MNKKIRTPIKKTFYSLIAFLIVIIIGIGGYIIIEKWSFLESLFMTIISITTVGYGEVRPLSPQGKIFTIFIIILGFSLCMYVAGQVIDIIVAGHIGQMMGRRKLDEKIKKLKEHYIVCGYGRIGKILCQGIIDSNQDVVVIEQDPEILEKIEDNVLYVDGNATEEEILLKAGIKNAKNLVACLSSDVDNVFLVLTAKYLNPDLFIMARANSINSKPKLRAAGATRVESPYDMGAQSMALRMLRPTIKSYLDSVLSSKTGDSEKDYMEEIKVSPTSEWVGKSLKETEARKRFHISVVTVKKENGKMLLSPSPDLQIEANDILVVVGERIKINFLKDILRGRD